MTESAFVNGEPLPPISFKKLFKKFTYGLVRMAKAIEHLNHPKFRQPKPRRVGIYRYKQTRK